MKRMLIPLAAFNIAIHVAAMTAAALGMRPGTPAMPLTERMPFLATSPPGWTLGWGLWMLCALVDVAFIAALAACDERRSPMITLGLALVSAGAAIDLTWDTVHITVLPLIAATRPPPTALFLAVERAAWACGAIVANAFYSIATLLVTWGLWAGGVAPVASLWLAAATFAAGMLMVVAGFTGVPRHLEMASAPTIFFFVLWTAFTARAVVARRTPGV
jgi:hypothetical protein